MRLKLMKSTNAIVEIGALSFPTVTDRTYVSFARHAGWVNWTEDILTSVLGWKEGTSVRNATGVLQLPLSITRKGVNSFWPDRIQWLRLRSPDGSGSGPRAGWAIITNKGMK